MESTVLTSGEETLRALQTGESGERLDVPCIEIKLFVARVPRSVDETGLRALFERFGRVTDVTSIPKGASFVRMASIAQADAAIRALNNTQSLDAAAGPMQVRYAVGEAERLGFSQEAAMPGVDAAKLFVGSLPKTASEEDVRALFKPFGRIEEVFIMKEPGTGQPRGCAFVKMAYKEQAHWAISKLHGKQPLPNAIRPLEVRFAEAKKGNQQPKAAAAAVQQQPAAAATPATQLPPTSPVFYTHQYPPQYGGMAAAAAAAPAAAAAYPAQYPYVYNNQNPRSAGAWKEYFDDSGRAYYHNEVTQCTQWDCPPELDTKVAAPPKINSVSESNVSGPPGSNIFVFHVPNDWTHEDLFEAFQGFGRIISARIATDTETNRNKGYAFVSFASISSAVQAVIRMTGYPAGNKRLKVTIKKGEEQYAAPYFPAQQPS